MPVKKWILQYMAMVALLFVIFSVVQYWKGHDWSYSFEFGIIWSLISSTLFLIVRVRNFRNRVACKVCNDIPE